MLETLIEWCIEESGFDRFSLDFKDGAWTAVCGIWKSQGRSAETAVRNLLNMIRDN